MPNDEDNVQFQVSKSEDGTEWNLKVTCPSGLTDHEYAVALQSLGDDILKDKISFDSAPEMEDAEAIDSDLH